MIIDAIHAYFYESGGDRDDEKALNAYVSAAVAEAFPRVAIDARVVIRMPRREGGNAPGPGAATRALCDLLVDENKGAA